MRMETGLLFFIAHLCENVLYVGGVLTVLLFPVQQVKRTSNQAVIPKPSTDGDKAASSSSVGAVKKAQQSTEQAGV